MTAVEWWKVRGILGTCWSHWETPRRMISFLLYISSFQWAVNFHVNFISYSRNIVWNVNLHINVRPIYEIWLFVFIIYTCIRCIIHGHFCGLWAGEGVSRWAVIYCPSVKVMCSRMGEQMEICSLWHDEMSWPMGIHWLKSPVFIPDYIFCINREDAWVNRENYRGISCVNPIFHPTLVGVILN